MVKNIQVENTIEIQLVRPTVHMAKYKVRKMAKSLLKHCCYCPVLLMQTTKTDVCLQTKAIFHHSYGSVAYLLSLVSIGVLAKFHA